MKTNSKPKESEYERDRYTYVYLYETFSNVFVDGFSINTETGLAGWLAGYIVYYISHSMTIDVYIYIYEKKIIWHLEVDNQVLVLICRNFYHQKKKKCISDIDIISNLSNG